jgi:hypothetical protein
MVGGWRSDNAVDASGHSFEYPSFRREAINSCLANAASHHLPARDEAPLILGEFLKASKR